MTVKKGDTIKVEYTGKFEDGTVFDSSEKQGQPLEIAVGEGKVIPGFEEALVGMEPGEEKKVTLEPDKAYGQRSDEMLKKVPKEQLPKEETPEVGKVLMLHLPNGMQFPAPIVDIGENEVTLDLNHPLAGKTLTFELKVVS